MNSCPLLLTEVFLNGIICWRNLCQRLLFLYSISLLYILLHCVLKTTEEFAIVVATKDLDFIWNLFAVDMQGLFVDASLTLFIVEYLVFM